MKRLEPHKTFFTSDLHINHKNIIQYCSRPWETVEEMNAGLVERWNEVVPRDGTVFVVGDVAIGRVMSTVEVLKQMNGQKVLVVGNHDRPLLKHTAFTDQFIKIGSLVEIGVKDSDVRHNNGIQKIVLCHFAMRTWNLMHRGAWHLYGHSHGSLPENGSKSFDVGVDSHNWYPWTYQEVKDKMAGKTFTQIDHHGRRE